MSEWTRRAEADIMPPTGRWITEPIVVGYEFFSDNIRLSYKVLLLEFTILWSDSDK